MECFNLDDINNEIQGYRYKKEDNLNRDEKRRWKELQEFNWTIIFSNYLKTFGLEYNELVKDKSKEGLGIDIILKSSKNCPEISLQLTHANEYDMRPDVLANQVSIKNIDTSGNCIINAAVRKCDNYCNRKIDTKKIILLIQGADESTKIDDLAKDHSFLRIFENIPCFRGIYYVKPTQVYTLKNTNFNLAF